MSGSESEIILDRSDSFAFFAEGAPFETIQPRSPTPPPLTDLIIDIAANAVQELGNAPTAANMGDFVPVLPPDSPDSPDMTEKDEQIARRQAAAQLFASEMMGRWPLPKALWRLLWPSMMSLVLNGTYSMIDSIVLSRFNADRGGVAPLTLAMPIDYCITGMMSCAGVGGAVMYARHLGAADRVKAAEALGGTVVASILMGLIVMLLFVPFSQWIMVLAGSSLVSKDIAVQAANYCRLVAGGVLITSIATGFNQLFRGEGSIFLACSAIALTYSVNIVVDPLAMTIFAGSALGPIGGAAIARVVAYTVDLMFGLTYFVFAKRSVVSLHWSHLRVPKGLVKQIVGLGSGQLFSQFSQASSAAITNWLIVSVIAPASGEYSTAIIGAFLKCMNFSYMPLFAASQALMPILAYTFGSNQRQRFCRTIKLGALFTFIMVMVLMLALILAAPAIGKSYAAGDDFAREFAQMLRIGVLSALPNAFALLIYPVFQASGHGGLASLAVISTGMIGGLPMITIFSLIMKSPLAIAIGTSAGAFAGALPVAFVVWRKRRAIYLVYSELPDDPVLGPETPATPSATKMLNDEVFVDEGTSSILD